MGIRENVYDRANSVAKMIRERMSIIARESGGISPDYPAHHAHNAMCAYDAGHPWHGVDYSKVRKILWLESRMFEGFRIMERWRKHA